MASSCKTEAAINQAAAYGTKVRACLTTPLPSLMKTQLVPSQTIPPYPIVRESTQSLHTATLTLTTSPDNSAFPGNHQRPSPFRRRCLSWALTGTFRIVRWPSPRTKGPSTGKPSRIGFKIPPITWRRRRSYLVSYYMPARFSQLAGPTLPIWKASCLLLVRTPLFPIMHHVTPQTILLGGTTFSTPPDSRDPSQVPPASPTDMPSQTPAQVLASALLLATGGGRGASSQDGRQRAETSDGLKPLASSFLLALSAPPVNQASTSGSLETTRELLKVGGRAEAETGRPTRFSDASTTSQILTSAFLSHATSPAGRTQRMAPPEASTRRLLVSSPQSAFQALSGNLSSTSTADPLTEQGASNGGKPSILAHAPPPSSPPIASGKAPRPLASFLLLSRALLPDPQLTAQTSHPNPHPCDRTASLETGSGCGGHPRTSTAVMS